MVFFKVVVAVTFLLDFVVVFFLGFFVSVEILMVFATVVGIFAVVMVVNMSLVRVVTIPKLKLKNVTNRGSKIVDVVVDFLVDVTVGVDFLLVDCWIVEVIEFLVIEIVEFKKTFGVDLLVDASLFVEVDDIDVVTT